jgi:hypothetical protein
MIYFKPVRRKKLEPDLTIEKQIADAITKGQESGTIKDKDESIYFWELNVNIKC